MSPYCLWLSRSPNRVTNVFTDVARHGHLVIKLLIDTDREEVAGIDMHGLLIYGQHYLLGHPFPPCIALPVLIAATFIHKCSIF